MILCNYCANTRRRSPSTDIASLIVMYKLLYTANFMNGSLLCYKKYYVGTVDKLLSIEEKEKKSDMRFCAQPSSTTRGIH